MNTNFQKLNQKVKFSILSLLLCFAITCIGTLFYFILLSRIGYFFASTFYINFWISLIIYSYFIINGIFVLILNLKFILVFFQKNTLRENEITIEDEPQFYALMKEVQEELELKYIPKIYVKDQIEIEIHHHTPFKAIFKPQQFDLLIGISLFQNLTRNELKAYIIQEIKQYIQSENKLVKRYANFIKAYYRLFFRAEDIDNKTITFPKLAPKSFLFLAYMYYFLLENITIEVFKYARKLTLELEYYLKKEEIKNLPKEYVSAVYKIDEYYRVHSFMKEFAIDNLHQHYNVTNIYKLTQQTLQHQNIKIELLNNYTNYLYKTKIDASHFEHNIEKFISINSIVKKYKEENIDHKQDEIFTLNSLYLYGFKPHQENGELAPYSILIEQFYTFIQNKKLPRFFNDLYKYVSLDFERIRDTYRNEEIILKKNQLFQHDFIQKVEQSHVLCRDLELIYELKKNHFKTIFYNNQTYQTSTEINLLIDELVAQHHANLEEIQLHLENLYVYFKTFQVDESKPLVQDIILLKEGFDKAHIWSEEVLFLKDSVYGEINDELINYFIKRLNKKFIPIKESIAKLLHHSILKKIYTEEILKKIQHSIDIEIQLVENGIYLREGFELLLKINTWHLVLHQDLIHLYTKKYLELNKNLYE